MTTRAYYNEFDPFAAAWLRNLIEAGQIAPGDVDDRSIADVRPDDLRGYTQCHFFAGIGGWSLALRLAGWPDERPVWTGSCPCPPFSSAGKKKACPSCGGTNPIPCPSRTGFFICCICDHAWLADGRHLYPEFWRLIRDCRPDIVFGEQVSSEDGRSWLDIVRASLEIMDYRLGYKDSCAAGIGAPHIRQRLWWVAQRMADAEIGRGWAFDGQPGEGFQCEVAAGGRSVSGQLRGVCLADAHDARLEGRERAADRAEERAVGPGGLAGWLGHPERIGAGRDARASAGEEGGAGLRPERDDAGPSSATAGLADANGQRRDGLNALLRQEAGGRLEADLPEAAGCGPTNGFWRDADWLHCRDERWRPVEPGTFPLVDGLPRGMGALSPELRRLAEMAGLDGKSLARAKAHRIGSLRGYGNAIVPQVAAQVIGAFVDLEEAA